MHDRIPFSGMAMDLPANAYTRVGYVFNGWNTKADGKGTSYKNKASIKLTKANGAKVTLYAQWKIIKYTVKFKANGGTGSMSSVKRTWGDNKAIAENKFKRTDYTFCGWSTTKGGSVVYQNKQKLPTLSDSDGATVTLYAVWSRNIYTLAFSANGGVGEMEELKVSSGATKELPANAFKKLGYSFKGWNTKTNGKGTAYKNKAKVTLSKADGARVTLHAQWKANTYKIVFDKNGGKGTAPNTVTATYNKEMKLSANSFTRANYTFQGWSTDKTDSQVAYKDKAKVKNLTDKNGVTVKLYAVWSRNQYTIILDPNGAAGSTTTKTVNCGDNVNLANIFKYEGYIFQGWATKKNGKVVYANGKSVKDLAKKGKSITLYAVWSLPDWAFGEFDGWCDHRWGEPVSGEDDWYSGLPKATVSSLGALSGSITIDGGNGKAAAVKFSASKFDEYIPSITVDEILERINDTQWDAYGIVDARSKGLVPSQIKAYSYNDVSLKLPDGTEMEVDMLLMSWYYDGKGNAGLICVERTPTLDVVELRQDLFRSKHLSVPKFNGTPTVTIPGSVYEDADVSGVNGMKATFSQNGVVTIAGYKGNTKKWTVTAPLRLYELIDGVYICGVDFVTPDMKFLWFDCDLKPGKDGKVTAKGITIEHDD